MLQLLDKTLIDVTSAKAKDNPRLRKNYNFHPSLDDKVFRLADGVYGVQLPKNVWHTIECLDPDTCVFEGRKVRS